MVTMSDVANAAGVSVMTVSHILNGRPRASAETQARVLAAVEDLGYEVNLTARHLRAGRTDSVALIVPHFHDYYSAVADSLADVLERSGRHLVLERTQALPRVEREALSLARLRMHDGALVSAVALSPETLLRVRARVPLVLLGERDMPPELDHVRLANEEGSRLATAHMVASGARRVMVLGGSLDRERTMATRRREGWERALRDAGLTPDPTLVVPLISYGLEEGRTAVSRLLRLGHRFDAVFAVTDTAALGAISALTDHGLRVPEDVQVAGFDNLDVADFVSPGLTSVDPNHEGLADSAIRLLERRMLGGTEPAEHVVTPVSLVVRGSTR